MPGWSLSIDCGRSSEGVATVAMCPRCLECHALPRTDPRVGYGTPTVLIENYDLFGMAEAKTPIAADLPT